MAVSRERGSSSERDSQESRGRDRVRRSSWQMDRNSGSWTRSVVLRDEARPDLRDERSHNSEQLRLRMN